MLRSPDTQKTAAKNPEYPPVESMPENAVPLVPTELTPAVSAAMSPATEITNVVPADRALNASTINTTIAVIEMIVNGAEAKTSFHENDIAPAIRSV
jgi:hypothetical protein